MKRDIVSSERPFRRKPSWLAFAAAGCLFAPALAWSQTEPSVSHSTGTFAVEGNHTEPDADEAGMLADDGMPDDGAPSAPRAPPEVREPEPKNPPFEGALWASGRWLWTGTQWQFRPGAWISRMPGYDYVNGYWGEDGGSWRWVPGGWAKPGTTDVEIPFEPGEERVVASKAPPAAIEETQPVSPGPSYMWAPGYWYWTGGSYLWMNGAWMTPPQPGLVVVSPRWVHRGSSWWFYRGGWGWAGRPYVAVPLGPRVDWRAGWYYPNYYRRPWAPGPRPYRSYQRWDGPRYHPARPYGGPRQGIGPRLGNPGPGRQGVSPRPNPSPNRQGAGPRPGNSGPKHGGGGRGRF